MKKVFLITTVALAALATLASCKKDQQINGQFTATIENAAKTTITMGENTATVAWTAGDQVWINGATFTAASAGQTTTLTGSQEVSAPYYAFYPTDLNPAANSTSASITLPATQTYTGSEVHAPMYAYASEGTELSFRNLCGILVLNLKSAGRSIRTITVTAGSDEHLYGTFAVTGVDNPALTYSSNGGNTVTLDCGTSGVDITNPTNLYIYLPPANYTALQFTFTDVDGVVLTKAFQPNASHTTFNVERNMFNPITFDLPPVGVIYSVFTVDRYGKKVYFSRGNLQYNASTTTWQFAEHQYDIVGQGNENIGPSYTGWIDLFNWGTGSNPTSTSTITPFVNWGINAISNGGNIANCGWQTLSIQEWIYILTRRSNTTNLGTDNARFTRVKVNGVKCFVLFPDGYNHPDGVEVPEVNPTDMSNEVEYTVEQWAAMEAVGAVLLPAAGFRNETQYNSLDAHAEYGPIGIYWSPTMSSGGGLSASALRFNDNATYSLGTQSNGAYGASVRLVWGGYGN